MNDAATEKDASEFKQLVTDGDRWDWILDKVRENYENGVKNSFKIMLDNDDTVVVFISDSDLCDDFGYFHFDDYIGQRPGIVSLLDALGVDSKYA